MIRYPPPSSFAADAPSAITTFAPASSIWYLASCPVRAGLTGVTAAPSRQAANMPVISSTRFGSMTASTPPRRSPASARTAATADTVWAKRALSSSWRSSAMQAPAGSRAARSSGMAAASMAVPSVPSGFVLSRRYGRRQLPDIRRRSPNHRCRWCCAHILARPGQPGSHGRAVTVGSSGPGRTDVSQDRGAEPLCGEQGQFNLQAVLADGMAKALFGLAYPVPDGVLVQCQPFGGGDEAAAFLQEDTERVAQRGVVVVVVRERPEGLDDPGPDELGRGRHQGQGRDLGEAGQGLCRLTCRQRDSVCAQGLLVGAAEAGDAGTGRAEGEPDP